MTSAVPLSKSRESGDHVRRVRWGLITVEHALHFQFFVAKRVARRPHTGSNGSLQKLAPRR